MTVRTMALYSLAEVDLSNRLLADYLQNNTEVHDLFAHDPEEMLDRARHARAGVDRTRLADALVTLQQELGADARAVEYAQLLADPTTPVVTAGQQPGLLTGPLYTIYKAISALNVARRLSTELGRPVVPVFWSATDDDDRNEVDHCGCWDQHTTLHALHYPEAAGTPGQLVGNLPTECYGEQVLTQLMGYIDGLPYADEVRELLQGTLTPSVDMGAWFNRIMAALFSRHGLVICDPRVPAVRELAAEIIRREIQAPLDSTARVNERARVLRAAGYRPQLMKPVEVCNFFLLDEKRQRVTYRDGMFYVAGTAYRAEELLDWLAREPTRFTPNAVLRPVVQEYLLGSSLFIAGPNELGYWAELHPVFQGFGIEMPPVMPRAGATLVPPAVARTLRQWHLNPLPVLFDYDQVRFDILREEQPETVARGFHQGRTEIEQLVARLIPLVSDVDTTLAQSALATHQRLLNELERLERKTLKAVERQSSEQLAQLERVRVTLFPRRGLQERTLNIFSVMARYGLGFFDQLCELMDQEEGRHLFIELTPGGDG
jgi:bacillithiol biosynthesis cysteine-adding enzyme BshC